MATETSTSAALGRIGEKLDNSLDTFLDNLVGVLPGLVSALLTLLVYMAVYWLVRRIVDRVAKARKMDATSLAFIQMAMKVVFYSLGGVAALGQLGVDTAAMLASLGIVGLTIGFAAKDALSNLISGVLIFWDRPFVLGDMVEVEGKYGRVDRITLRSTRVVTPDGKMLAVPNAMIISTIVASYTNFPHLRIAVDFTVGVNEDLPRIRALALELARQDPDIMRQPGPSVTVTALNDYNIAMALHVWLDDEKMHLAKQPALREALYEVLRSAGVDMPFQTLALAPVTLVPSLDAPRGDAAAPVSEVSA